MKQIKHYSGAAIALLLFLFVHALCSINLFAQSAGFNYTGAKPHPSALLDISDSAGTHKGLLIPRISLTSATDATTVASPAVSLLIYNKATAGTSPNNVIPGYYYWNGTKWVNLASSSGGGSQGLTNNAGISGGTILIGGTGVSDSLILRSTSGAGTTGSDIIFQGGTNGATELMRIKTRPSQTVSATGGTITFSGGYTIHTFTTSGTFTPATNMTVEYLVVGGGGGGGEAYGGGGGAGGFLTGTISVNPTNYSITVGNGGTGAPANSNYGQNGGNSIFYSITAIGGGGGGFYNNYYGQNGGSGGGGPGTTRTSTDYNSGAGIAGQGHDGGFGKYTAGGGGGGASVNGGNSTTVNGGNGGDGITSSISGLSVTYGGGGGGPSYGGTAGIGGAGGGGNGALYPGNSTNGAANTGGGGGGAVMTSVGGNGGSGIVILRYLTSSATPSESIVGIGTSAPTEKLDVAGNVKLSGALMPNNNAGISGQVLTSNGAYAAPGWTTPTGGWSLTGNSGTTASNFLGTTGNESLRIRTNNTQKVIIDSLGRIGIGTTSPTAVLHLKAGTATANTAPLKFSSGTNLTTGEAGALEYDGTNFFVTNGTATRYTVAKVLTNTATLDFASTGSGAVADLTITVAGASVGDAVVIGVPNGSITSTATFTGWVSAANTVTIRFSPKATEDPASGTFKATVIKD